jgi:hypothetical protein
LDVLHGIRQLELLCVNQVRGLHDVSTISSLPTLRLLSLFGLSRVTELPSLAALASLERVDIGQMRSLPSLSAVLDAPGLRELCLVRTIAVLPEDVARINSHPTLRAFSWFAEDVPVRTWQPVLRQILHPSAAPAFPREWLDTHAPAHERLR